LIEPEIKDTRDTARTTSYLDLHLQIDSESSFICYMYIPAAPAYGIFMH